MNLHDAYLLLAVVGIGLMAAGYTIHRARSWWSRYVHAGSALAFACGLVTALYALFGLVAGKG